MGASQLPFDHACPIWHHESIDLRFFPLHRARIVAIVPPPLPIQPADRPPRCPRPPLNIWLRLLLVLMAGLWVYLFSIALRLDPYKDGKLWLEGTHRQLGFPDCTFKVLAGLPCPSCGMSTSFALFGLAFIPWALVSAGKGRLLFIRRVDVLVLRLTIGFVILLFGRWGLLLLMHWLGW